MNNQKVVVIGLDCAAPKLIFDLWKDKLPNLSRLMKKGIWGPMQSCNPPITVPAWMCMMTGYDPGTLGVFGFRERDGVSYTISNIADSSYISEKTVWDYLGENGKKSIVIGVPPTYPVKKINGIMVSDFLTPSIESVYTYPNELKQEIKKTVGTYLFDTKFRIENRKKLLDEIIQMTEKRFTLAKHLLRTKPWDFFMMVEIGVDRIHHSFWKFFDKTHQKYVPNNPYELVIFQYYQLIDQKIGELLSVIPKDTTVMVVSDHGAKAMDGAICLNEWLIQNNYLVLKKYPKKISTLEECDVDWSKTKAWAWGGYYARVFLNIKGRDPKGIIPKDKVQNELNKLTQKLQSIPDEKGNVLQNQVKTPHELYTQVHGNPSDLFVIFDNLSWRCAGTIGHKKIWIFDNDTGPDDAVHDWNGVCILHDPNKNNSVQKQNISIYDIAPTILSHFEIPIKKSMKGTVII